MDNKNNTENEKKNQDVISLINSWQLQALNSIEQAKEPSYVGDIPIVLPNEDETTVFNMFVADAGVGKSLLSRAVIQYILDNYDDIVVIWVDLEFQEMVAKQRRILDLIANYSNRFYLITQNNVNEIRENSKKLKTTFSIVNFLLSELKKHMSDKRFFCVIDSFEDLVEDTSNDTELKRHFNNLSNLKSFSFLFNHHINKDAVKSHSMRFRGSMIIKAKLSTLLLIQNKTKEDDFTLLFELLVLKVRTAFPPSQKISVRVDINNFEIKDMLITTDVEEIKILKSIYFLLMKEKELQKTVLVNTVSQEVKKRKEKVRAVIQKYSRFFDFAKGVRNEEKVSLTKNVDLLDEFCSLIGVQNRNYTEKQRELWKVLLDMNDDDVIDLTVNFDNKIVEYKYVKTLKNHIHELNDKQVDYILSNLVNKVENTYDNDDVVDF